MDGLAIGLTGGGYAIVDEEDYAWLNKWKWRKVGKWRTSYAARTFRGKAILMHREVLRPLPGLETDHINGNGLDNRRANLRSCTRRENACNRGIQKNNTSGCPGVTYDAKKTGKEGGRRWRARHKVNGKRQHLGWFRTFEEAKAAYEVAADKAWGSFRRKS
jgi:hypothetical protein